MQWFQLKETKLIIERPEKSFSLWYSLTMTQQRDVVGNTKEKFKFFFSILFSTFMKESVNLVYKFPLKTSTKFDT